MQQTDQNRNGSETGNVPESYDSKQFFRDIVTIGALVLLVIIPIHTFLFQPFFVQGSSMEPNFKDGEYLIIDELGYKQTPIGMANWNWFTIKPSEEFKRGDVIVFRPPGKDDVFYIKRVIGLPGETLDLHNGTITVSSSEFPNGRAIDELAYLSPTVTTAGDRHVVLGPDEYYVLGDNRGVSQDSRYFGSLSKDRVVGKVIFRAWPFHRYGVL